MVSISLPVSLTIHSSPLILRLKPKSKLLTRQFLTHSLGAHISLLVVTTEKSRFTNHQVTASNALTTQKMRKSRNSHAPVLMQQVRPVLLETSTDSMSTISTQSALSGTKLPAKRSKTTTLLLPALGVKTDQRFALALFVVQSTSLKFVSKSAATRENSNSHMFLYLKFSSVVLKTGSALF
jgi:hypothetical protein